MRPGQNKRMRGRNNNNNNGGRRGPNPLTRSYESNGPDVKIRGTAQHIGEKYLQLARDAQTSGDPVAAESYLQHAEHYFRLIASAQQAQSQAQAGYQRQAGDSEPDDGDDDDDLNVPDRFALPSERVQPPQPQAYAPQQQAGYGDRSNGQGAPDRANGQTYPERQDRQDGQERNYRQDRQGYDRDAQRSQQDRQGQFNGDRGQDRNNYNRNDRNQNRNRFGRDGQDGREPRDNTRDNRDMQFRDQPRVAFVPREQASAEARVAPPAAPQAEPDLPAFITAPVRVPSAAPEPEDAAPVLQSESVGDAPSEFGTRPRRRRRARMVTANDVDVTGDSSGEPSTED